MAKVLSRPFEPIPRKVDCWPLSLPPTLMRSTSTPGAWLSSDQGSRAVGTLSSSTVETLEPWLTRRSSSRGLSPVTVIVSVTAELRVIRRSALPPTRIATSGYSMSEKPWSSALTA